MDISETPFGKTNNGETTPCYHMYNASGLHVSLIPYGATLAQVQAVDKFGQLSPITLGFPNLSGYLGPHPSFGSTVGRFANRIADGVFTLDGKTHTLSRNEGAHHLHGGEKGLGRQWWNAEPFSLQATQTVSQHCPQTHSSEVGVTFSLISPAGDMGYPGNLEARTTYILREDNTLTIRFWAQTDAPTHVNFTNHAYWNLALGRQDTVHDHTLLIAATHRLSVDENTIPTGEYLPLVGTDFDFSTPRHIGQQLEALRTLDLDGFDHCYANPTAGHTPPKAVLKSAQSGRCLSIESTQPGLQLYTSQFLSGKAHDGGFGPYAGICLEPQHYPNTPNRNGFPSTRLNPGSTYEEEIQYRFWVEND